MVLFHFNAKVDEKLHSFFDKVLSNTSNNPFFSDVTIEQIDGTKEQGGVFGLYKFSFNHLYPDFSKYVLLISGIMILARFFISSLFLTIPIIILIGLFVLNMFLRSGFFMYLIMKAGLKKYGYNIDYIKWRG